MVFGVVGGGRIIGIVPGGGTALSSKGRKESNRGSLSGSSNSMRSESDIEEFTNYKM